MKYDLFERLNTGGTRLTDQEIRNCVFRAEAPELMTYFDGLAGFEPFQAFLGLSENKQKSLYDRGLVLRFFALKNGLAEFKHDVEQFVTEFVHKVVDGGTAFDKETEADVFQRTVRAIADALGGDSWLNLRDGKAQGTFSVYVFEALTVAVARNLAAFEALDKDERSRRLNAVKADEEFRAAGGPGGNTKPRLLARLAAAERFVRGA